jgi:hypothetical protein
MDDPRQVSNRRRLAAQGDRHHQPQHQDEAAVIQRHGRQGANAPA